MGYSDGHKESQYHPANTTTITRDNVADGLFALAHELERYCGYDIHSQQQTARN